MDDRRSEGGFTLVEVLLTVAIITVVMLPLLMWASLVFKEGADTSINDRTNAMSQLSQYLQRDASGVLGNRNAVAPVDADADALNPIYAACGMPSTAKALMHLIRPGEDGWWIVYYSDEQDGNLGLHRLKCTDLTQPGDDTLLVEKLAAAPEVDNFDDQQIRIAIEPDKGQLLRLAVKRNISPEETENTQPFLSPIIECTPNCTVNRAGSPLGSADPNSLKASITFNGRLSRSELPITHYQWSFIGADGQTVAGPIVQASSSALDTPQPMTYTCRSISLFGKPASAFWQQTSQSCKYIVSLTIWSGGAGATPAGGSAMKTASQTVEVRNNPPRPIVAPVAAVVGYGQPVDFNATGTSDIDGVAANLTYDWDFGDGETATGLTATHEFKLPVGARVDVKLTVTDDDQMPVTVTVPIQIDISSPNVIVDLSCTRAGQPETGSSCLGASVAPWSVTFDAHRTSLPDPDPAAKITDYRFVYNFNEDTTPWITAVNGLLPANTTKAFPTGVTPIDLQVRTNQMKDGERVVGHWYSAVIVNGPPMSIANARPSLTITPLNNQWPDLAGTPAAAQRHILDGSSSYEVNPAGAIGTYVWEVRSGTTGTGPVVYTTPGNHQDKPIIGCSGYENPAGYAEAWTISPTLGPGGKACPPLTYNGTELATWPAGKYTAALTVTNHLGKVTRSADILLIVNRPPNASSVDLYSRPSAAEVCTDSWNTTNLTCVYRGLPHSFAAKDPTDPDGDTAFSYDWTFTGDQGTTLTMTGKTVNPTFTKKDESFSAVLEVKDDKGGVQRRSFTFIVRNQNPKADIVVSKVHGWSVGGTNATNVANTYNVLSGLSTTDPGTTVFTSGVSKDTDTSLAVTCEWTFESAVNTPDPATRTGSCDTPQSYTWSQPWGSGAANVRKVTLKVTDGDGASQTVVKTIRLYKRPVATIASTTQSGVAAGEADISFNLTGSTDPNAGAGALKYWVSWGDDCNTLGVNCVAQPVTPNGSNVISHRYNRAGCKTNMPTCGTWKMQLWTESTFTPEAFAGPSEPPVPASNGLSLVAEQIVRVNEKPKIIFGGANARITSPIDVNGESYGSPNVVANGAVLGFLTCSSGTSCTYQVDGLQAFDPDGIHGVPGQTDGLSRCTGPLQVGSTIPNDPCLTYEWTRVEPGGAGGLTVTVPASQKNLPNPTFQVARTQSTPGGGNFRVDLKVTDRYNESTIRRIYVVDLAPPTVNAACKPFNGATLGRGVANELDGTPQWGLASAANTCGTTLAISSPQHYSVGIFTGSGYGIKVNATAAAGGNPATLVRQAVGGTQDQTKNSWINEGFIPGTKVVVYSSALGVGGGSIATIDTVTDSTLTFSSATFGSGTGVTDMTIVTQCGGALTGANNGMGCVPDRTAIGGSGMTAPNYLWNFQSNSGTECTATVAGKAATVTFRPVNNCSGNATLTVTDETGGTSAASPNAPFSVADARPVANIKVTSPIQATNPTTDVVGTSPGFAVGFDGSDSYDPDGAAGSNPGPVSSYRWTVQQTAPTTGTETDVSTAAVPNPQISFPSYGSYTVRLYVTDNVPQTSLARTVFVKVYQRPSGSITASVKGTPCAGSPGSPSCNVVDPTPYSALFSTTAWTGYQGATIANPAGYSWDFGDPTSGAANTATGLTPPAHTFSGYGTYTVTLTVTDSHGVTGTQTATVYVDPPPTVTVTAEYQKPDNSWAACPVGPVGSQIACSANREGNPVPVRLTASVPPGTTISSYAWTFGDPASGPLNSATGAVVTHTYPANATYTAHLVATTNRGASAALDVKIKANQLPNAVVKSGSTTNPASLAIQRNVATTTITGDASNDPDPTPSNLPDNGIQAWHWVFTGQTPGNGCDLVVDGKTPTITLAPATTCDGTLVLTVTDYDGWTSSTAPIPVHVAAAAPIAIITTDKPNDVGSLPDGQTVGQTIGLIGTASNQPGAGPGAITSYVWVVQDATMTQVAPATCISNPAQPVCKWSDASGTNATVLPTLGVGSYRAYLTVTSADGQTATADRPFQVNAPPVARITATVTAGNGSCTTLPEPSGLTSCSVLNSAPGVEGPFGVSFTDASRQNGQPAPPTGWTWSWNFGDPNSNNVTPGSNTSTQRNPSHTFSGYGTYTVTMTVTDLAGASSTTTAVVTIHRPPVVAISANYSPIANPTTPAACTGSTGVDCAVNDGNGKGTVNFTATASSPDGSIASYAWVFGDGGTSTATNPTHVYNAYGLYTVTVTVTDNVGGTARATYIVKINQKPTAAFTVTGGGGITMQRNVAYNKLDGSTSTDPDRGPGARPDNGIQSWSWAFTSSNPACTGTYTGKNPVVTFSPPQVPVAQPNLVACSGNLVLTVTDHDSGTGVTTSTPFVVNNIKPIAAIVATGEMTGVSPFSPTFAPSGSNDPDTITSGLPRGDIQGYEWTVFKGAAQYRAPIVQTSFAEYTALEGNPLTESGTYTVRLVVIDTHGTRSDPVVSGTITVLSAPTARVTLSAADTPQRSNGTAISLPSTLPLPGDGTVRAGSVEFDGSTSTNPNAPATSFVLFAFEVCKADSTGSACDTTPGSFHQTRNAPGTATKVAFVLTDPGRYIVRLTVMDSAFSSATSGWSMVEVRP